VEGTGKPNMPANNGVAWQDLSLILNSNLDVSLGLFTNRGENGQISLSLSLTQSFIADLHQGDLGLYLTARSDDVGFTFNSRDFGNTNAQPFLSITAAANPRPRIDAIGLAGTNVSVSFEVVSNWAYRLQGANMLPPPGPDPGNWSDLLTIMPQLSATNVVYLDGLTNGSRFYRLVASP